MDDLCARGGQCNAQEDFSQVSCVVLWQAVKVGTVGGSDLAKQLEQLGKTGDQGSKQGCLDWTRGNACSRSQMFSPCALCNPAIGGALGPLQGQEDLLWSEQT